MSKHQHFFLCYLDSCLQLLLTEGLSPSACLPGCHLYSMRASTGSTVSIIHEPAFSDIQAVYREGFSRLPAAASLMSTTVQKNKCLRSILLLSGYDCSLPSAFFTRFPSLLKKQSTRQALWFSRLSCRLGYPQVLLQCVGSSPSYSSDLSWEATDDDSTT